MEFRRVLFRSGRIEGTLLGGWESEDEEHDNIRTALAWARDGGQVDLELRFASSAGLFYWSSRGHLTEGRRWLEDVLVRSEGADERLRARALLAAAQHAWRSGEYDRCDTLAAEAEEIFVRLDDRRLLGMTHIVRGIAAADGRGDFEAEERSYDAAA